MKFCVLYLKKVVKLSSVNKMDLQNISTCFAMNLIDTKAAGDFEEAKNLATNAKVFLMSMIANVDS